MGDGMAGMNLHHQQQKLITLISAALPKEDQPPSNSALNPSSNSISISSASEDDSARVSAVNSLHRVITYPPNYLLVARSASFLCPALFNLLSDKSHAVRQAAVSVCACVCAITIHPSYNAGGPAMAGSPVERFIGWALPHLRDMSSDYRSSELALAGLSDLFGLGDAASMEIYAAPVLRACQDLLEDERTSLTLLRFLLNLLGTLSQKFTRQFQTHFADIVDLLLGWALMPDLSEADRCVIMNSFLQFQKLWLSNLQFSLNLLTKFLGDMEVVVQDATPITSEQPRRFLALVSCFVTVLQATAAGVLEMNLIEHIIDPLQQMLQRLLLCLSMVTKKFDNTKWLKESSRCLILFANILKEHFAKFYIDAVEILLQTIQTKNACSGKYPLSSKLIQMALKSNLQLMSTQQVALLPSAVQRILQTDLSFAILRLHPNHHVTSVVTATYLFLLKHSSSEVLNQAISSLKEELYILKSLLDNNCCRKIHYHLDTCAQNSTKDESNPLGDLLSEGDILALIKFDLMILRASFLDIGRANSEATSSVRQLVERANGLSIFLIEKLDPFSQPLKFYLDLQYALVQILHRLFNVIAFGACSIDEKKSKRRIPLYEVDESDHEAVFSKMPKSMALSNSLNIFGKLFFNALDISAGLSFKMEAMEWVISLCRGVIMMHDGDSFQFFCHQGCDDFRSCCHAGLTKNILFQVLYSASDREIKVRHKVASVLELLLQAELINPVFFETVANVTLQRLGDSDASTQSAFRRVLSLVAPSALYLGSFLESYTNKNESASHSKLMYSLTDLQRKDLSSSSNRLSPSLCTNQLVCVLNFLSQRGQAASSSWLQRFVVSYLGNLKNGTTNGQRAEGNLDSSIFAFDTDVEFDKLDRIVSTSTLAAAWLSIHEAARHCINVRLRTHLGNPTQTFAALERMLLDIAQMLQVDPVQRDSSSVKTSSSVHLLPMRLLLEFVESLKRQIYNAYEGSVALPVAPAQSGLFFRANKKVCEEWFTRICEAIMNASLAIHCDSATYCHAATRLQDLRNVASSMIRDVRSQNMDSCKSVRGKILNDALRIARHAALALCRLNEADAIIGLQKWATSTFSVLSFDDSIMGNKGGENHGLFEWMTGLVYQARGQFEKATAHFIHMLQSEEALSSMGAEGVQFVIARMIDSYVALADWESLDHWLQELQVLRAKHAGKAFSGALTTAGNEINAVHALARFDAGDVQGAWGYLDLTPQNSNELTVDPRLSLLRSEQMLLQAMLRTDFQEKEISSDLERAKTMLEDAMLVASIDGLPEAAPFITQLHCIHAFEQGHKLQARKNDSKESTSLISSLHQIISQPISSTQRDFSGWIKLLRVYNFVMPESSLTLNLSQKLIKVARKQSNIRLAHHLLEKVECSCLRISDSDISESLKYERILLTYAEGKWEEAIIELWTLVHSHIQVLSIPCDLNDVIMAKACVKLSSWLRQKKFEIHWQDIISRVNWMPSLNDRVKMEELCGASLKAAVLKCPNMSKSWLSYASWCFAQAKSSLSQSDGALMSCNMFSILNDEITCTEAGLSAEESRNVRTIIYDVFMKKKTQSERQDETHLSEQEEFHNRYNAGSLEEVVRHMINVMQLTAGARAAENSDSESTPTLLYTQFQHEIFNMKLDIDPSSYRTLLNDLMAVWWMFRRRRVSLFGFAARGFLQYLSLSNGMRADASPNKRSELEVSKNNREDWVLRATLYILHILLNYGVELQEIFQESLMTISPLPWQAVIPQLFARLSSHPEKKIRKHLEMLLITIAKLSPWAIVYPTLVDISAYDGEPSEELQNILDCLIKVHPKLVKDVDLIISELGKITVLWEEQWLSTLQELHGDVIRRIDTLKEEVARVAENTTLSQSEKAKINAAKYSAMMAPIVVSLERRLASTSRIPETAHETWFQKEFSEQIKTAITNFKIPPINIASLANVWRSFDLLAASLANHQKKSFIYLQDIAPRLAALASSDAPVPGLEQQVFSKCDGSYDSNFEGLVTISSFNEQFAILGTKTKPKKLVLLGSDGQRYTYLLKGREDLRLDARIMQLLHAVDGMLRANSKSRVRSLVVRYYSVTPISGRAGLIQWVENIVSMYGVYKSWQQRIQAAQISPNGNGINSTTTSVPPVPRPSDMFYGKIIPALKEKGLRKVISRRDWPQEVKRKVLLDLMKETPRQLLYKEIWCASEGFQAFRSKLHRFSGSVAVMSMVGHIIGLGDRHLDNVLMDFNTGDVVHIDYNVCFDKGLRLKIPEIVPFRLTQVMQAALGLTGTEGEFRESCEFVLDIMRRNKDVILMLLEVFVWDPLIDWMRGDGHDEATIGGEERKGMELAVSLSLFASRVQEIRVPLQEHHDLLLSTIPSASSVLQNMCEILDQYEMISTSLNHAEQERAKFALSEASAKSIVAEASSNLEKVRRAYEVQLQEFAQAKAVATDAAQKASMWVEQHGRVLDALRTGSSPELQTAGQLSNTPEALSLTAAVLTSGVPLTIVPEPTLAHCRDVDMEITHLNIDFYEAMLQASTALQSYSVALQQLLPGNYIATSQVNNWSQILQLSVRQLSPEALNVARRQGADLISKGQGEHADAIVQKYETMLLKMETLVAEIKKLKEDCSEIEASIEFENEYKAKERVLAIFTKHLQPLPYKKSEEPFLRAYGHNKYDDMKEYDITYSEHEEKKIKILTVLHVAVADLYNETREKVSSICNTVTEQVITGTGEEMGYQNWKWCLPELEESVERCCLIASVVNQVHQMDRQKFFQRGSVSGDTVDSVNDNWASDFQSCLLAARSFKTQITTCAVPEAINLIVSHNPAVMEAFGSLSQIRGMVDTALEQLAEVEMQRSSLEELKKTYHENVEDLSARKASLEMAMENGRDHLSWEEADELGSQVEACRTQLDKLYNAWEHRDEQASTLAGKERNVEVVLVAADQRFQALLNIEKESDMHVTRGRYLLAAFARPFLELESYDKKLLADGFNTLNRNFTNILETASIGFSGFDLAWKITNVLKDHTFFVWKVGIIDALLDSCIRIVVSPSDHPFGIENTLANQKRKTESLIEYYVDQYLRERFLPVFQEKLTKEMNTLKVIVLENRDTESNLSKKELDAVKRAQGLLLEYSNVHETTRAAKAATSAMKSQVQELSLDLQKTFAETSKLEWLHYRILSSLKTFRKWTMNFTNEDNTSSVTTKLERRTVLDSIRSAMSSITRVTEGLQNVERSAASTEEQLDRAMGWACAGSSTTGSNASGRGSGIPPEFHEHLNHRRQLLWAGQEQAANMLKLCAAVLDFENSRDGFVRPLSDISNNGVLSEGKAWQQAYMNIISRLEITYRSFNCVDHDLHLAQKNMEAASANMSRINNDLQLATMKLKSNSGELQTILSSMHDLTSKASSELSVFCSVARGNSALTTETGSMLEEVLAITEGAEGAHDVYRLAKEAAAQHKILMAELNKVNKLLLPLETMITSTVNAIDNLTSKEGEKKFEASSSGQGQALIQSFHLQLREVCPVLTNLVPMLLITVKDLHETLTRLARTASFDAGVLHKAFEAVGESQDTRSQEIQIAREDIDEVETLHLEKQKDIMENILHHDRNGDFLMDEEIVLHDEEDSWISPPDSMDSGSYISDDACRDSQCERSPSSISFEDKIAYQTAEMVDSDSVGSEKNQSAFNFQPCLTLSQENTSLRSDSYAQNDGLEDYHHETTYKSQRLEASQVSPDSNKDISGKRRKGAVSPQDKKMDSLLSHVEGGNSDQLCAHFSTLSTDPKNRLMRGKNPYAVSVLKRVEAKLDGQDIDRERFFGSQSSISEQVDHLLRQATSIDNLCNMYEGWTPWI